MATNFQTRQGSFTVATEITRVATTATYAIGQLILRSTSSTVLPTWDFSALAAPGTKIQVSSITVLSSNGTAATKLSATAHICNTSSVTGSTLADGTTFSPTYAAIKAVREASFEDISTTQQIGTSSYLVMQPEVQRFATLDSTGKVYCALVANNAYVPASAETLNVSIKGYLL